MAILIHACLLSLVLLLIVWLNMPRFFRSMPGPAAGSYRLSVLRTTMFGGCSEVWSARTRGRLRGYLLVRLAGLWCDLFVVPRDRLNDEIGVHWRMVKED